MPLFDNLKETPPDPPRGEAARRRSLADSVRRELERLLNTRVSVPAHRLRERQRSVIDYGIPDFSHLGPKSKSARIWLEREIGAAIAAFEPRLVNVQVSVELDDRRPDALSGKIEGLLADDGILEPISFPVLLRAESGKTRVHAGS